VIVGERLKRLAADKDPAMTAHGAKPSHFHGYAKELSEGDIVVTYFGKTRDGIHSFDVHRKGELIGVIKRIDHKRYFAWRNGHDYRCGTLGKARDWIVARQKESP